MVDGPHVWGNVAPHVDSSERANGDTGVTTTWE